MAAEVAVSGTLRGFVLTLLALVLEVRPLTADSLRVEMAGETQTVLLNDNAIIPCKVICSSHLNIKNMGVIWFRKNPVNGTDATVFEFYADHREAFRSGANVSLRELAKGDASLHLPKVQLWEAGQYRCKVVNTPDEGQGTVFLEVVACPVSSLFVEKAEVKDNDDQRFLCKASGFYPKGINITWCKWSQENSQCLNISENVTTNAAIANEDNTFNVTSFLRPEHNVTYQCRVEHMLCTPWRRNITLSENGSEPKSVPWELWIIFSCVAVLVVAVVSWKRFCRPDAVVKRGHLIEAIEEEAIEISTPRAFIYDLALDPQAV